MVNLSNTTMPTPHTIPIAGIPVRATVTARPAVASRWVQATRWLCGHRLRSGAGLTVGMGVQWTPSFRSGADERPGTLQLCAGRRCLVFQLAQAGGRVPAALRRFLADARVTFAGYNVHADCRKLRAHHGLDVATPLELRGGAGGVGGNASMEEMAARLLGIRGVEKSRKVGMSKWDVVTLSKKQVRYACVDAFLSCRLGVHIR